MARLTVKLHGEEVCSIELEAGNEYIAGRASDVQITLGDERGISRHHLKFYERDGLWICESLSKFVMIQLGGNMSEVLELTGNAVFTVSTYEFTFESERSSSVEQQEDAAPAPSENLPTFYQPEQGQSEPVTTANSEATMAGVSTLIPYIRVSYPDTADDEVLKLEGGLWVAGRDSDCEIPIRSPSVSRKHFELARTQEGIYITDLGSSNGTKLNGQRIPPHEPTRLDSGDEISVQNVTMYFEIRDSAFTNRMQNLPVPAFDPALSMPMTGAGGMPTPWYPAEMVDEPTTLRAPKRSIPRDWRKIRPRHLKHVNWRENKVRVALVVLIPILLVAALLPSTPSEQKRDPAGGSGQSVVYDNLKPEQKASIKDAFVLARNLYVQGKYELCLTELAKVHELIPQYENSKEVQSFCEQGRVLKIRQEDQDRRERERLAREQQINGYVETCKATLQPGATVDETRRCLADAMELDPEHSLIVEMIHTAQMREEEQKFLAQQRAETSRKAARGDAHYEKAKKIWKSGKLTKAIAEYERFLNTEYPRDDAEKKAARRELASIRGQLKTKVDSLFSKCKAHGEKNDYRAAYLACSKVLEEDPGAKEADDYRERMHGELKIKMKSIYQDSVLEESLGNVDTAKEKWRRIMKENLDFDEYTLKAKSKLQKYGLDF